MKTETELAIINTMTVYTNEMRWLLDRLQTDSSYPSEYKQQDGAMLVSEIERANNHLMGILERKVSE